MDTEALVPTDDAKRVSTTIDVRVDDLINMSGNETFHVFHDHLVETFKEQLQQRFGVGYEPVFSNMTYQSTILVSGTIQEPGDSLRFIITALPEPF